MAEPKQTAGCPASRQSSLLMLLLLPLLEMFRNVNMNFQQGQNKRLFGTVGMGQGESESSFLSIHGTPCCQVLAWWAAQGGKVPVPLVLSKGSGGLYFPLSFPLTLLALFQRKGFKYTFPFIISSV